MTFLFNKLFGGGGNAKKKKPRVEDDTSSSSSLWKVVRLAAQDRATRERRGGDLKSPQTKHACDKLTVLQQGVTGIATKTSRGGWLFGRPTITMIKDYNHYRTQGHGGRFEAQTKDRAVSIATVAAYQAMREAGITGIEYGDLGENILIQGPDKVANEHGNGLYVTAKLQIGTTLLEMTEANNPCYRFNTQSWAAQARALWGKTAPEGNEAKWFQSPECPLNHQVNPGVRGWLAKVVCEGEIEQGDTVTLLVNKSETLLRNDDESSSNQDNQEEHKNKTLKKERSDGAVGDSASPSKRQKTGEV
eukprot:scaffold6007_cov183-Amphora_coffeaeformis.AAC.14